MEKLYYKAKNGYVCQRYPYDLPIEEGDPYIELEEEEFEFSKGVDSTTIPIIKNGVLTSIEYKRYTNSLEHQKFLIECKIKRFKRVLSDTDYIISKLQEISLIGTDEELIKMKESYATQIEERKNAREQINLLEKELETIGDKYKPLEEIKDTQGV